MNDTNVHFFQNEVRSFASILTATSRSAKAFTLKTIHVAKVLSPTTEIQLASKIYGSVADNCQSTLMPALSYTKNPAHTCAVGWSILLEPDNKWWRRNQLDGFGGRIANLVVGVREFTDWDKLHTDVAKFIHATA